MDVAKGLIAAGLGDSIADLARMVAIDTPLPPGRGYDSFACLMEELVALLGFNCERVVVPQDLWKHAAGFADGERINLIASRRTGKPVLGLCFHVDTVPPQNRRGFCEPA